MVTRKQQQNVDEQNTWQYEIKHKCDLETKKMKLEHDTKMRQLELKLGQNVEMRRIALEERKVALREQEFALQYFHWTNNQTEKELFSLD